MKARGQTLVLMALTMLLVVLMACMTLSISSRVRRKLELQTVADTAAYNNAVSTARGFNSMGLLNRTIVSHYVVMLGIEANLAWGSTVPAYFDSFADGLNDFRRTNECGPPNSAIEQRRQAELTAARDAFHHASLSVWNGPDAKKDPIALANCPGCFKRLDPGLGQLDKAVADQSKDVWRSVRDLVEVQRDIHLELQKVLEEQTLATQATLAAQGRPLTAADTFPYQVHRGAPTFAGIPERPPGWREVSYAIGSTREALTPLAHAAMGARGSRFVISGKFKRGGDYFPYTPRRAKLYMQRIEKAMNAQFAIPNRARPFRFMVRGMQSSTYLDDGHNKDNKLEDDADQVWQYIEEADSAVAEAETNEEAAETPIQYEPDSARRITPERSVGLEYATGQFNGTIYLTYISPCFREKTRERDLTAIARSHTDMTIPSTSGHEWQQGDRSFEPGPDGTKNVIVDNRGLLHGVKQLGHGYDSARHGPGGQCHNGHRHWGEADDRIHTLGKEIEGLGLSPGGFGFIFPQNLVNAGDPDHDGASGAFGQPKTPVLLTRANTGRGMLPDPWNLTLRFQFTKGGSGALLDLAKQGDTTPVAALSTGIAYYHRRCTNWQPDQMFDPNGSAAACTSWNEAPNLLNPFWRATLVPIDIDETMGGKDLTPGNRLIGEGPTMLDSAGLSDAAQTYRLLKGNGYEGIQ